MTACQLPGDLVYNIKGQIVDSNGDRYSHCLLSIMQGDKSHVSRDVEGKFKESIVVGGLSISKVKLQVGCEGSANTKSILMPRMPDDIDEYIDVGVIVLERK
jgi:hypothetical protein